MPSGTVEMASMLIIQNQPLQRCTDGLRILNEAFSFFYTVFAKQFGLLFIQNDCTCFTDAQSIHFAAIIVKKCK